MALSSKEQELFDQALKTLPHWMRGDDRAMEEAGLLAKVAGLADDQGEYWADQALITTSTGPVGAAPDWLAAHARDRDTDRQPSEDDPTLRARLRTIEDAVTRPAVLAAAQAIVDAAGVVGDVAGVELPRDGAFSLDTGPMPSGTGGTFSDEAGTTIGFEPDVAFTFPPYHPHSEAFTFKLVFSSSNSAGNDGTFAITGLLENRALITNASGVAEVDAGVAWALRKYDADGNRVDGFRDSYFDRGDRFADFAFIVILPYGTDEATADAVADMIRQKKGMGYPFHVERRLNP